MKLVHQVSFTPSEIQKEKLESLGVTVLQRGLPLTRAAVFIVKEDHPHWPDIKALILEWSLREFVGTEFSKQDLETATYLKMGSAWDHGYPQPEDDFGYREQTYAPNTCACEIGKKQIAPFRMKREPKWGTRHAMGLNWVFDELFVRPEIWETVFRPLDVECLPVIHHHSNKALETVVQLAITDVAESKLLGIPPDHPTETCEKCGKTKYHPIVRGFFPPFEVAPSSPICKTQEYFGSGGSAWNAVIISAKLYKRIQDHKLKGLAFEPLANDVGELTLPLR